VTGSYVWEVRGSKVLCKKIRMRIKFFVESILGCDCIISDKRDIKIFMEGIIGDIERGFCDFA
jgi:hypothetical protein